MRKSILSLSFTRIASGVLVTVLIIAAGRQLQSTLAATSTISARGAGKTIIEGGTGGTTPVPVTTTVAFHADENGGDFECLALAPASGTGNGSGDFSVNAMYVTGKVTSLKVNGRTAILMGTATVTGLGAGTNVPFTVEVLQGGPGTTVKLTVSGLTFHEILLEGQITVQSSEKDQE